MRSPLSHTLRKALREVSIVILSYNRREELCRTLTELGAHDDSSPFREILVADNASADGTVEMLERDFPHVLVIETGGNCGITGSNLGYRAASGRWVLSLDDDSHPVLATWEPLARLLLNPGDDPPGAIALSVRGEHAPLPANDTTAQASFPPAYGFSAAGVLFHKSAIESVGTYDEELFLFVNELHWSARALQAGKGFLRADACVVVHRAAPAQRSSTRHAFYYARNLLLLLLRYAPCESRRALLRAFLRDLLAFTFLHRTTVYVKALASARRADRQTDRRRTPLSAVQWQALRPDLKAPLSYLG